MRHKLSTIFGCLFIIAMLAGAVEGPGGEPTAWTPCCITVALIFGTISKILENNANREILNQRGKSLHP